MKIDNRTVNGRITIEQEDTIRTWTIAVDGQSASWFAGFDETKRPFLLPAGVILGIDLPSDLITVKESK